MGNNLYVITATRPEAYQHYIDTIEKGFDLESIKHFLSKEQITALQNIYVDGKIRAWGSTPGTGNGRTWQKMEVGDPILIYRKGNFEYYAFVTFKIHKPELAKFLWGSNSDGETWEYIYLLDRLTDISVPTKVYNDLLGYKSNNSPYGFAATDAKKVKLLEERFGSLEGFLDYLAEGKWIEKETQYPEPVRRQIIQERLTRHIGRTTILEANLENLIVDRVDQLEPGLKLIDRQLDTKEVGRLDLLCEDRQGDLVVVELKRAAAGPSIIDQTQRYMGWIMKNKARPQQKVRGIIVVGATDTALEYAVHANPLMSVKEFSLSFR